MKKDKDVLMYVLFVVAIVLVAASVVSTNNKLKFLDEKTNFPIEVLNGGRWECVAKNCTSWYSEGEWVAKNCKLNSEKSGMSCQILYNSQYYDVPLVDINTSTIRSCKEYLCLTEVFVKNSLEVEQK